MFEDAEGIVFEDGVVTRGARFLGLYAQYQLAVATLVAGGADVLLDEVLLGAATDQLRWREALGDNETHWVACAVGRRSPAPGRKHAAIGWRVWPASKLPRCTRASTMTCKFDVGVLDVVQSAAAIARRSKSGGASGTARSTGPLEPACLRRSPAGVRSERPWES